MNKPLPADLVVQGARVWTLDALRPAATAFVVASGRFRVVGADEQVRPFIGARTEVLDARGATVIPGLIDAHLHLFGEGQRLRSLDLVGTRSRAEVLTLVRERASQEPGVAWIRGRGWDQNDWPETAFPTAADLDSVVAGRPVALTRIDGHAMWVNSRALAEAGIQAATPDPEGGRIVRDARGAPTGVLVDRAMDLVRRVLPPRSPEEKRKDAVAAARQCVARGLTAVHEPGIDLEEVEVLKSLYRTEEMPLRIYAMLDGEPEILNDLDGGPQVGLFDQRLTVRAVKLYADGALGSRGAALLRPYADDPENRGLLLLDEKELERRVQRIALAGFQPAVHAIGDRANRMVLDVYERVYRGRSASRPRIEHAQLVAPEDLPRFARLGVVASMQPTHATSDMPWVPDRLGARQRRGLYAWSSLRRAGTRLAFGSDAPVESVDPFLGLYAAVTRQDRSGKPEGGWIPEERVSLEEALGAYTTDAAYASFAEDFQGSIAPGRLADFVVLAEDPRAVPPERLPEIEVLATYVGGKAVFHSGRPWGEAQRP